MADLPGVSVAKEAEARKTGEAQPFKDQGIKQFPGKGHSHPKAWG